VDYEGVFTEREAVKREMESCVGQYEERIRRV
jgi:predicted component of type VI protein secretion system